MVDENTDLEQLDPTAFVPYTEVATAALVMLDEAIAIAGQASFEIPGTVEWINTTPLTSAELIRLANSYAARILAYTPRTSAERAAVNWSQVVARVDAGRQQDLAPEGLLSVWESNMRRLFARVRTRPGDHARVDYYAVGPADHTGGFQAWHATPSADRQPFQMNTPDRRIQGAAGPSALGSYVGYNRNSIWAADRGTYRWSWYYYLRSGAGDSYYTGPQPTMTKAEMDLIKAEGLIRLGRASEAVPLINSTRVANGALPPVTVGRAAGRCPMRAPEGGFGGLREPLGRPHVREEPGVDGDRGCGFLVGCPGLGHPARGHGHPASRPRERAGEPGPHGLHLRWKRRGRSCSGSVQRLSGGGEPTSLLMGSLRTSAR